MSRRRTLPRARGKLTFHKGNLREALWALFPCSRAPAPPVMEFDNDGNFIQGWGGESGPGYQLPSNELNNEKSNTARPGPIK